eukprot:TRINITY_DN911_c0_g1_i5.p1 TRINITY_DN911_c0_g1~~TRINITY_DN911_c0_g1_i5.p1  ORF type:complete len:287 (-),score=24.45 TRINITY_DN911_c0_g1_i5:107-967(-)
MANRSARRFLLDNSTTCHYKGLLVEVEEGVRLQTHVSWDTNGGSNSSCAIIFLHPHPWFGGEYRNNVVSGLFQYFESLSYTCCRINFRGVGLSSGRGSWRGSSERKDLLATCRFLLNLHDDVAEHDGVAEPRSDDTPSPFINRIVICGYSYGSIIGSSIVNELDEISGFVAISYPFGVLYLLFMGHWMKKSYTDKPNLWLMGTKDNFTSISRFSRWFDDISAKSTEAVIKARERTSVTDGATASARLSVDAESKSTKVVVDGMDHFWNGRERELGDMICVWMTENL